MSGTNTRLRRNKNKTAYRWSFYLFVVCLVIYFWLFVGQALNQSTPSIIFCFLFLIGGTFIFGWCMMKEVDFEKDPSEIETEETKKIE